MQQPVMTESLSQQTASQNIQVPEWEHENGGRQGTGDAEKSTFHIQHAVRFDALSGTLASTRDKVRPRFNTIFPPDKKYLGQSRKRFLIALLVLLVILLGLVIGLAVGLGGRRRAQNLPLPSNRDIFTGDFTYYDPGLGACGVTSSSSEDIVAVSHVIFDAARTGSDPNSNPLCGRRLRASRFNEQTGSQQSVDLTVVDRCVGCVPTDIDVSISAFTKLAAEELGRVKVTWAWL
ncbi:Papain inhibitor [Sphaceloma murrayae]|uniref:Papain inhibitor n=1 Tax=Sphaceloma murrayae TaxID=2082308 RepID=A0A2K1QMS4_9PEZI|nr:Papain inhibitor [Sphaceloma murrayae]